MQNQPKDGLPSDTRKNPKECMAVTLRSGKKLKHMRVEKKDTEEHKHAEIGEEFKQHNLETAKEDKKNKNVARAASGKRKSKENGTG